MNSFNEINQFSRHVCDYPCTITFTESHHQVVETVINEATINLVSNPVLKKCGVPTYLLSVCSENFFNGIPLNKMFWIPQDCQFGQIRKVSSTTLHFRDFPELVTTNNNHTYSFVVSFETEERDWENKNCGTFLIPAYQSLNTFVFCLHGFIQVENNDMEEWYDNDYFDRYYKKEDDGSTPELDNAKHPNNVFVRYMCNEEFRMYTRTFSGYKCPSEVIHEVKGINKLIKNFSGLDETYMDEGYAENVQNSK